MVGRGARDSGTLRGLLGNLHCNTATNRNANPNRVDRIIKRQWVPTMKGWNEWLNNGVWV